jgi:hypothetical protein
VQNERIAVARVRPSQLAAYFMSASATAANCFLVSCPTGPTSPLGTAPQNETLISVLKSRVAPLMNLRCNGWVVDSHRQPVCRCGTGICCRAKYTSSEWDQWPRALPVGRGTGKGSADY